MSLLSKAVQVQQIFREVTEQNHAIQNQSNLHCIAGCGKCCHNPKVPAFPIEFIPFAISLFRKKQLIQFLEALETSESDLCPIYTPNLTGSCSDYFNRGLICRVFGAGAQRDKNGQPRLITCTLLKEQHPTEVKAAEEAFLVNKFEYASTYYDRLKTILPSLSHETLPIKEAIRVALEYTLQYTIYSNLSDTDDFNGFEDTNTDTPLSA